MRFWADFECGRKIRWRILFDRVVSGLTGENVPSLQQAVGDNCQADLTTSNLALPLVYCSRTSRRLSSWNFGHAENSFLRRLRAVLPQARARLLGARFRRMERSAVANRAGARHASDYYF